MFDLINSIAVDRKNSLPVADLHARYRKTGTPVVFGDLCQRWPALNRWTPAYLSDNIGSFDAPLYSNNFKINNGLPYKPVANVKLKNFLEDIMLQENDFRVSRLPIKSLNWLKRDFTYPRLGLDFNINRTMLSIGGAGAEDPMQQTSVDTQTVMCNFGDKVSVLLVPPVQSGFMYRVGNSQNTVRDINFHQPQFEKYPALKKVFAYVAELDHGDSLYIPAGFWFNAAHHGSSIRLFFETEKANLVRKFANTGMAVINRLIDTSALNERRLTALEHEVIVRTNNLLSKSRKE